MQKLFTGISLTLASILFYSSNAFTQELCTPPCELEQTYFNFVEGNPSPYLYLDFISADYVEFNTWGLNAKLNGSPSSRYIDVLTVYVNGAFYARLSGDSIGYALVVICDGPIYSVSVEYSNGIEGSDALGGASIGIVSYCGTLVTCESDADNDGLCDNNDPCPNDFTNTCQPTGCVDVTRNFDPSTLTHSGNGSSSVVLNYGTEHIDISFTISDLDSYVTNNKNSSYVESVEVYADGSLVSTITASGEDPESAVVNIESASIIEVILSNAHPGGKGSMSVELSEVTSCNPWSSALSISGTPGQVQSDVDMQVYPNPSHGEVNVRFDSFEEFAEISVYDVMGRCLLNRQVENLEFTQFNIPEASDLQMVFVTITRPDKPVQSFKLMLSNK